jgi:hypothetical protein
MKFSARQAAGYRIGNFISLKFAACCGELDLERPIKINGGKSWGFLFAMVNGDQGTDSTDEEHCRTTFCNWVSHQRNTNALGNFGRTLARGIAYKTNNATKTANENNL